MSKERALTIESSHLPRAEQKVAVLGGFRGLQLDIISVQTLGIGRRAKDGLKGGYTQKDPQDICNNACDSQKNHPGCGPDPVGNSNNRWTGECSACE